MKAIAITVALMSFGAFNCCLAQTVENLALKDYRPRSIYNIHVTEIEKAKFPVIDMHSHEYARSEEEIEEWIGLMDRYGIEKTILLTAATGEKFDSLNRVYSGYDGRFELWCGFDYTGYEEPGWSKKAIRELERCHKAGARGVGELGDKGLGLFYSDPTPAFGMHLDDPRLKPVLQKCAELNMPVNVHVAEPKWMYEPMDSTNDGLMNAYDWRLPEKLEWARKRMNGKDIAFKDHGELIQTLENAVRDNPEVTFIACHMANCSYDPGILGRLLDKYPNLYADISARYAEMAPIPRHMKAFFEKYQDRLLYGTDMEFSREMYETTFRILQTADEHFYKVDLMGYHWPLHGFDLNDKTLKKLYKDNAEKILNNK